MLAERRGLVVDDIAIMRAILGRILREAKYEVIEAPNGADAMQAFFKERPTSCSWTSTWTASTAPRRSAGS